MIHAHVPKCCYALPCLFWITSICLCKSTHTAAKCSFSTHLTLPFYGWASGLGAFSLLSPQHSHLTWSWSSDLAYQDKLRHPTDWIGIKNALKTPVSRTRVIRSNEKTLLSDCFQNVWRTYTDLTLIDVRSTVFGIVFLYIMIYCSSFEHTTHRNNMSQEVCPGECLQKRGKREVVLSALHWNRCLFSHDSVPAWEVRLPVSQKGITPAHVSSSFLLLLYCS